MTNVSAPLFTDTTTNSIVDKQKAELYMQIYKYAAEDFLTTADANMYELNLLQYLANLEIQLTRLFTVVATHTHMMSPHIHPIAGPATCLPNIPQPTLPPVQAGAITWTQLVKPKLKFTTKTTPNFAMNYTVPGVSSDGALSPGLRRALPIPITLKPSIPPVLKGIVSP